MTFSAQITDPDGDAKNVGTVWAFGDGGFAAGESATHTYTTPGVYTASLTVTDERGGKTTTSVTVTVSALQASTPTAKTPDAAAAPRPAPWIGLSEALDTTVGGVAKRGLTVRVTCTEAMSGTVKLTVSRAVAKSLGLKRTTLASSAVRCAAGSRTVTLKPTAAAKRALGKAKRTVKVTVNASLKAQGGAAKRATRTVTLTRR